MFRKLTWFLAYRYFRSKHENGLISFISVISVLGVTIGTSVLIIVLSVLSGFKQHVEQRLLQKQPHLIIDYHDGTSLNNIEQDIHKLSRKLGVEVEILAIIKEQGLLKLGKNIISVNILSANKNDDNSPSNGLVISRALANKLSINKNDKIIIAAPVLNDSIVGPTPRFKRFNVTGLIDSSVSKDRSYLEQIDIIMPYDSALKFFDLDNNYISGLFLYLDKPLLAASLKQLIISSHVFRVNDEPVIATWYDYNHNLFQAIKLEKLSIILLLCIIITVACFNLISALYIQVTEKQKDMAILRTYGLSGFSISSVFIIQGLIIGLFGGLIGSLCGILISSNLHFIVSWLQYFGLFDTGNIFLNAIVSNTIHIQPDYSEIGIILSFSLIMCILATIVPAARARKIRPIEIIKND